MHTRLMMMLAPALAACGEDVETIQRGERPGPAAKTASPRAEHVSPTTRTLENKMEIYRPSASQTSRAPESSFTGDVQIGNYYRRAAPSRIVGATAIFAPGSRTPWKVNPLGQTLIVTSGVGWAQCGDSDIVEIQAGDSVWCPPGERHWEGATPTQAMTYVAVQEEGDAGGVQFVASVTDEEYRKGPPAAPSER